MEVDVTQQTKRATVKDWLGAGSINIFGIQFSGKDTQCQRLAAWTGGAVFGGGDIMRNASHVPQRVRDVIASGDLAPFDDYVAIITPYFAKPEFDGRPLLLSAVGRGHGEEPAVVQAAEAGGHALKAVIWLELDEAAVWRRWELIVEAGGREAREDDHKAGLGIRLARFAAKTLPVRDFYEQRGLVIAVDGSKSPDSVEAEILDGLYGLATRPA